MHLILIYFDNFYSIFQKIKFTFPEILFQINSLSFHQSKMKEILLQNNFSTAPIYIYWY
jgi:hypothetical protein